MANASPEQVNVNVPAEPTMIDFVDPATVSGLSTVTMTEGEGGNRFVHILYPRFESAPKLTELLHKEADRQLRAFKKATPADASAGHPELNVDWQLTAATDDVIGVRLRTGEFLGANWGNATRTFWYHEGRAVDSTDLVAGKGALSRLAVLVKAQLERERGSEIDHDELSDDAELFDSMAFNPDGDLIVEFDDCQVGPCSLGRVAVAVPEEQARPLLSAVGRDAQEAAQDAEPVAPVSAAKVTDTRGPAAVSSRAGSVDCAVAKCVALTFDDGPGPDTGRLLDLLDKENARATFFTVGSNAAISADVIKRMSEEGHLVANHSWSHRDLAKLPSSKITDSLGRTQDALTAAAGQTPTLVRPPYGATDSEVQAVAKRLGLALVNWDVDTFDWRDRNAKVVADRAVGKARRGSIILMHDVQRTSVDAVPDILNRLRGKGYTFVTVPELYGSAGMQAGRLYTSGP